MLMLSDSSFHEIITFLDAADAHGKKIVTVINTGAEGEEDADPARHNVSVEARQIKKLFLKLRG